jgi:hypothetical protein
LEFLPATPTWRLDLQVYIVLDSGKSLNNYSGDYSMGNIFSEPVTVFHGFLLPEEAIPVWYVALSNAIRIPAPSPRLKMAIGVKHSSKLWIYPSIIGPLFASSVFLCKSVEP